MYKWNAEEYKDNSPNQKKWALELLAKAHLKGYESVLDIGCGDGEITALIAGKVNRGRILDRQFERNDRTGQSTLPLKHPILTYPLF